MAINLPANVRAALKAMDDLGFDTTMQAAKAILQHTDWNARWDIDLEYVSVIAGWRQMYVGRRIY